MHPGAATQLLTPGVRICSHLVCQAAASAGEVLQELLQPAHLLVQAHLLQRHEALAQGVIFKAGVAEGGCGAAVLLHWVLHQDLTGLCCYVSHLTAACAAFVGLWIL